MEAKIDLGPVVIVFVNLLTLLLVTLKVVFGWPGTWLLAFSPLVVWWVIWFILTVLSFVLITIVALRR